MDMLGTLIKSITATSDTGMQRIQSNSEIHLPVIKPQREHWGLASRYIVG